MDSWLTQMQMGMSARSPRAQVVVKNLYEYPPQRVGQGVAWVIGNGPNAICWVLRTPVRTWEEPDGLHRLGLHLQMCG